MTRRTRTRVSPFTDDLAAHSKLENPEAEPVYRLPGSASCAQACARGMARHEPGSLGNLCDVARHQFLPRLMAPL